MGESAKSSALCICRIIDSIDLVVPLPVVHILLPPRPICGSSSLILNRHTSPSGTMVTTLTVANMQLAQWTDYCIVAASGAVLSTAVDVCDLRFWPALLIYEYLITIGQECRLIWKTPRSGNCILFLLNRLNMLFMCTSLGMFAHTWHKVAVSFECARPGLGGD